MRNRVAEFGCYYNMHISFSETSKYPNSGFEQCGFYDCCHGSKMRACTGYRKLGAKVCSLGTVFTRRGLLSANPTFNILAVHFDFQIDVTITLR